MSNYEIKNVQPDLHKAGVSRCSFSVGDIVDTPYGIGVVKTLWQNRIHTVEITQWNGVGYPAKLLGVFESDMKLRNSG